MRLVRRTDHSKNFFHLRRERGIKIPCALEILIYSGTQSFFQPFSFTFCNVYLYTVYVNINKTNANLSLWYSTFSIVSRIYYQIFLYIQSVHGTYARCNSEYCAPTKAFGYIEESSYPKKIGKDPFYFIRVLICRLI